MLNKIADRIEQNLEMIAVAETWDNGKPVRETLAGRPAADHRSLPLLRRLHPRPGGRTSQIDDDTVAYHFHEPLGVVGQIIPWNFPLLMAAWKLAPALAAGNCVVLKPAEQTPASILLFMELIGRPRPAGRAQHRQRLRHRGGQAARVEQPHRQDRLHRRDDHGPAHHAVRVGEPHPGRRSSSAASRPNIFFEDVLAKNDDFARQGAWKASPCSPQPGRGVHLPVARPGPAEHPRRVHGARRRAHRATPPGQPARHRHHRGRAGVERPAREDPELHRHRQEGGRQGPDRRRAGQARPAISPAATT